MKKSAQMISLMLFYLLTLFVAKGQADTSNPPAPAGQKGMVIEIDYGGGKQSRTVQPAAVKGKTALETLMTVAAVETHPVGPYVFVAAIDGVRGKRGETAWYYSVDGQAPRELAYTKRLDGTEGRITWSYQRDVCSRRVDGTKAPDKAGGRK